jgi:hypothetical protein
MWLWLSIFCLGLDLPHQVSATLALLIVNAIGPSHERMTP